MLAPRLAEHVLCADSANDIEAAITQRFERERNILKEQLFQFQSALEERFDGFEEIVKRSVREALHGRRTKDNAGHECHQTPFGASDCHLDGMNKQNVLKDVGERVPHMRSLGTEYRDDHGHRQAVCESAAEIIKVDGMEIRLEDPKLSTDSTFELASDASSNQNSESIQAETPKRMLPSLSYLMPSAGTAGWEDIEAKAPLEPEFLPTLGTQKSPAEILITKSLERKMKKWAKGAQTRNAWGFAKRPRTVSDMKKEAVVKKSRFLEEIHRASQLSTEAAEGNSEIDIEHETPFFTPNKMIHPNNTQRRMWDFFMFFLLLYCAFSIPYRLSFLSEESMIELQITDFVLDALFVLDIILNFSTAYVDLDGKIRDSFSFVAANYIQGWFLLDVVATIPIDQLITSDGMDALKLSKVLRLARLGKLLRILRLVRLMKVSKSMDQMERSMRHPAILRLLKLCFFLIGIMHWFACMAHATAMQDTDPDTWIGLRDYKAHFPLQQYTCCLYWATCTMLGEKSSPQGTLSLVVTCIVFWMGMVLYLTAFGNIVNLMNNMDLVSTEYKQKLDKSTQYMRKLQIPTKLRSRIVEHIEAMHERTHGMDSREFMAMLPRHLRHEVAMHLNCGVLENMEVFAQSSVPFLTAIIMRVRVNVALAGDLLVCEGDIGSDMFFIVDGELAVWVRNHKVASLVKGSFFGESVLFDGTKNGRRSASVRATKNCTLYSLELEDFQDIFEAYPEDGAQFLLACSKFRNKSDVESKRAIQRFQTKMLERGTVASLPTRAEKAGVGTEGNMGDGTVAPNQNAKDEVPRERAHSVHEDSPYGRGRAGDGSMSEIESSTPLWQRERALSDMGSLVLYGSTMDPTPLQIGPNANTNADCKRQSQTQEHFPAAEHDQGSNPRDSPKITKLNLSNLTSPTAPSSMQEMVNISSRPDSDVVFGQSVFNMHSSHPSHRSVDSFRLAKFSNSPHGSQAGKEGGCESVRDVDALSTPTEIRGNDMRQTENNLTLDSTRNLPGTAADRQ
ncbi:hypothetical protein CYMTET_4426 [Cymbomonas tetramitiformis]|uniref:Cyclic nucleotide-binding domain-containing protein n=1 Tax=Cymbomonas tetramitiformis TaxID=36881 RepID=A0AAE0H1E6_9CHLO|nr:hypothetical protein CYMTET_4426 [Cymbomonas tetramitiformis]